MRLVSFWILPKKDKKKMNLNTKKLFQTLTFYFGVNFNFKRKINLNFVLFFIFTTFVNLYHGFYVFINEKWYDGLGFYKILGIYQSMFPFFIQNFIIFRAYILKDNQNKIFRDLEVENSNSKHEKLFLLRIFYIFFIRCIKFVFSKKLDKFNMQTLFPELIYSSNDLMFIYYLEILTENLENIKRKIKMMKSNELRRKICEILKIKRKIISRYSIDIFITFVYHFNLSIISFYWILMRLVFNHLYKFSHFGTFTHFFVPFFMYWNLCSKCDKFRQEVSLK